MTAPRPDLDRAAGVIGEYLRFLMKTLPRDEAELDSTIKRLSAECAERLSTGILNREGDGT